MRRWTFIALVGLFGFAWLYPKSSFQRSIAVPATLPNGVAAGDVTSTTAMLWTRSTVTGIVTFVYGTDPTFATTVGSVNANGTNSAIPVKVQLSNLQPHTTYFYRATNAANAQASGKFRTLPATTSYHGLNFGVSGDWNGQLSPFVAVRNVPSENLNLFIALGDTVYADQASPILNTDALTTSEFRLKHTEVYSTRLGLNTLADLRSSMAILSTIDDHEVVNDFAGGELNGSQYYNDSARYEAGLQAFQEYNPIVDEFYGATGDPRTANERKLYRSRTYGKDAAFFMLDARSFRDGQLWQPNTSDPDDVAAFQQASFDANRTMLGHIQLADLKADLLAAQQAGITWKFVLVPEPIQNLGLQGAPDRFEGYAYERTQLLSYINANAIENVVFVSADIHGTVVNNLQYQTSAGGAQINTNAFDISTGSVAVTSPLGPRLAQALPSNLQPVYQSSSRPQKDLLLEQAVSVQLGNYGYSPIGLQDAPFANRVEVLAPTAGNGSPYFVGHTFGWTKFAIDQATQNLTVTTYGVDLYNSSDLTNNPNNVINRQPEIMSQFRITPAGFTPPTATPVTPTTTNGTSTATNGTPTATTVIPSPSVMPTVTGTQQPVFIPLVMR